MWMKSRMFQRLGGGWLERIGIGIVSRMQMSALRGHKNPETLKLIRQVRKERYSLVLTQELFIVHSLAKAQARLPGDFAEVGVFQGSTARLMCEVKGDRPLRLFDTFEGLPKSSDPDRNVHREHQYTCSMDSVRQYLGHYPNVSFHKGIFPESAVGVPEAKYAFAHFDVDLYEGTKACLEYFYPRMLPGGVMLSHDYSLLTGVEQAFHEFLADKPEWLVELPTTQCMVIKL